MTAAITMMVTGSLDTSYVIVTGRLLLFFSSPYVTFKRGET